MTHPLLDAQQLSSGYGEVQLLWNVDLQVSRAQIVALLGPNGSGKTTLLKTLVGLIPPWDGRLLFEGKDLSRTPCHRRVARGLGMVPAGRRLFLGLSVEDNLRMGAYLIEDQDQIASGLDNAYQYFPDLVKHRRRIVGALSGGEQQMCAIARGLMSRPRLLIIDELSLGLAPRIVIDLVKILLAIREEEKIALLFVEQDLRTALGAADYAYVLSDGRLAMEGSPKMLAGNPLLKEVFLGAYKSYDEGGHKEVERHESQ